MKTLARALIATVLITMVMRTWAYEVETHEELSAAAVGASVLKTQTEVLVGLGLKPFADLQTFPNSQGNPRNVIQLFREGSRFEDANSRPANHFYNPLTGQGIGGLFFSSPDWALEDGREAAEQEFSYRNARQYFYDALTKGSKDERARNFGLTFETLGHVIHHIQDMAQPQHVRNDLHCDLIFPCKIPGELFGNFYNPSLYEKYTDSVREKFEGLGLLQGYPSVYSESDRRTFDTPRKFWRTSPEGQTDISQGKGIAEFTNTNFLSAGTNFLGAFQNGQLMARPHWRYPLPEPKPVTPTFELANNLLGPATPLECAPPNNPCVMAFFASEVKDNYRGTTSINNRASTASIFDQDLQFHGIFVPYPNLDRCTDLNNPATCEQIQTNQIFSLNRFNFDAAHEFLIPRAVAYSAGLIDYFFRGRLEAEDVQSTDTGIRLRVKNGIARSYV